MMKLPSLSDIRSWIMDFRRDVIRTMRLKFICVAMGILIVVFLVMLTAINMIMKTVSQSQSMVLLRQIAESPRYDTLQNNEPFGEDHFYSPDGTPPAGDPPSGSRPSGEKRPGSDPPPEQTVTTTVKKALLPEQEIVLLALSDRHDDDKKDNDKEDDDKKDDDQQDGNWWSQQLPGWWGQMPDNGGWWPNPGEWQNPGGWPNPGEWQNPGGWPNPGEWQNPGGWPNPGEWQNPGSQPNNGEHEKPTEAPREERDDKKKTLPAMDQPPAEQTTVTVPPTQPPTQAPTQPQTAVVFDPEVEPSTPPPATAAPHPTTEALPAAITPVEPESSAAPTTSPAPTSTAAPTTIAETTTAAETTTVPVTRTPSTTPPAPREPRVDRWKVPVTIDHFAIFVDTDGKYLDLRNTEDYTDEEAEQIMQGILAKNKIEGMYGWLQFCTAKKSYGTLIVVTDKTSDQGLLNNLFRTTVIIGICMLLVLLAILVVLSHWITLPVQQAFKRQKQFVSDAGHELKTPLAVLTTNADILQDELGENKWLTYMQEQIGRMNQLVGDLLRLARMDNATQEYSFLDFDLSMAVAATTLPFESTAFEKHKNLEMDIQPGVHYCGSEQHIRQLCAIFIDNAIKYSNENGIIKVTLLQRGEHQVIEFYNTGCEISPAETQKIFERFYRGDKARTSSKTSGYGLGLAIAKSIMDIHKIKFQVTCEQGRWIRFLLIL